MAYADLSNEKTILLEQLEVERHHSQQLQMQLEEQRNCYDGLLSDAKRHLTRELDREHTHSRDLHAQLKKQCSRYEDQQEQLKELHSRYDDRNRQLLDVATRNGLLSDANINLTKELEKESRASSDLQA